MRSVPAVALSLCTTVALLLAGAVSAAASPQGMDSPGALDRGRPELTVEVVSSRPDMITDGDALVEVNVPHNRKPEKVSVFVGEREVTDALTWVPERRVLTGVIDGLPEGSSELRADVSGRFRDSLTLTNHPGTGPLLAGPQETPFVCETERFTVPVIGEKLGVPLDEQCSVAPRTDYFYRTTENAYVPWPEGATEYPADLQRITTTAGDEVPFVVRMETSTVNRGIAQSAILHDPLVEPEPSPTTELAGWNGRIVYTLGGGCAGGWYRQGSSTGGVTDSVLLAQGYAVVSNSLNVFGNNCNDLLAAETATMTKEAFLETVGADRHAIGLGCSGGSYQAQQIVDNYPGIFDGIVVGCSFPEVGFATVNVITDARLLQNFFQGPAGEWAPEQQRAVTGFLNLSTMDNVSPGAQRIDPREFCDVVPEGDRYDPDTNPDGVRCGVYDHTVNVYGTDADGYALRPLDNRGIQYGLAALQDGTITIDQFLDLNEKIGGYDRDGNFVEQRTTADMPAVEAAYRSGRLTNGGLGLATTPIIDYRAYADDIPSGDIHLRYHTNSLRQRLVNANGNADNHVSVVEDFRYGLFSTGSPLLQQSITQMDQWLTAIDIADDARPSAQDVVSAKPSDLVDGCMTRDENPTFLAMPLDRDPGTKCEVLYPSASFPREVAGEDIAADTIVCETTQPTRNDYPAMNDEQWTKLTRIFAGGVCDYSKPGIGQQAPGGEWQRF